MPFAITIGGAQPTPSNVRESARDALNIGRSLVALCHTKVRITDTESNIAYAVDHFERLLTQTKTFDV